VAESSWAKGGGGTVEQTMKRVKPKELKIQSLPPTYIYIYIPAFKNVLKRFNTFAKILYINDL